MALNHEAYKNCDELPLRIFCKIVNTSDLRYLYKKGFDNSVPANNELEETWNDIFDEYVDRSKAYEIKNNIEKRKKLLRYLVEFEFIKMSIIRLSVRPDKELIAKINSKGYKIDPKNYQQSLENAFNRGKNLLAKAESLKLHLEQNPSDGKMDFNKMMAVLHVHNFTISEDITVNRYLACLEILKEKK